MKKLIKKLASEFKKINKYRDVVLAIPRITCGLLLAFNFGSSKFGMPWSMSEELPLFSVSEWFVEDVHAFGGLFALTPFLFAWLAAASETIGGLFLALGLKTRAASFFIMCTMLVAIFFQKWGQGVWAMLPAMGFLWVTIDRLVLGAGTFSLDHLISQFFKKKRLIQSPLSSLKLDYSKIRLLFISTICFSCFSAKSHEYSVTFKVDMNAVENVSNVSLQGSIAPLSWDNPLLMEDPDRDGIYEARVTFITDKKTLRFKFVNNEEMELYGSENRTLKFESETIERSYLFNEFNYYTDEEISALTYNEAQIKADISILKEIVQYVHPQVYKYRDSLSLQDDFTDLENEILQEPTMVNAYKAISKFAALLKCSHTFTNPWNQNIDINRSIFYQPDKIPFTFNRIGKRVFIDLNASENKLLTKGLEVISINGKSTDEIMSELAKYVTSDGSNFEKKLERLTLTGEEKFSLFDIFYSLVFGSNDSFDLELKDIISGETIETTVKATSKTNRTKILRERYDLETGLENSWKFRIIDNKTAVLSIKSFAVQRNEFDWKAFLDRSFEELKEKSIANLIIDIRENEGGQTDVVSYILERVLQKTFEVSAMKSSVSYMEIPDDFRKHIRTWDQFPYNFNGKIASEEDGRYYLKEKYSLKAQKYNPRKDGFKGKVFLITDASNSSATHLMAMYAKQIEGITIVGQETGGNEQGLNGGFIFFMRLPNTGVELDIPVIHQQVPLKNRAAIDGGVRPDIMIDRNAQDFVTGVDTELNALLEIIGN